MSLKNQRYAGVDISFDSRTRTVMAKASPDGILEKVKQVQELVPSNVTKDNILLVLEYYEKDVERTIQAFLDDGAKEALSQWTHSAAKPNTKKKKKTKPSNVGSSTSSVNEGSKAGPTSQHTTLENVHETVEEPVSAVASQLPAEKVQEEPASLPSTQKHRPKALEVVAKPRERTISEQSTSSISSTLSRGPHGGLEKSLKDLNRQISSLSRIKSVLREKSEKSDKEIRDLFKKMTELLENREVELMLNLQKAREQAKSVLEQRQKMASDLKRRADRAPSMTDVEKAELRADIKHFVSERKIDEDLGTTQRFKYDLDSLTKAIEEFGTVLPPKTNYSQRRPSVTSITSSVDLMSPVTPLSPNTPPLSAAAASQLSGAKVLSQSDSLTKYEIQNKDKLVKTKPGPNRQPHSPKKQEDKDEEKNMSRSARRRLRQRDKQRQIRQKKYSGEQDDQEESSSASPRRAPPKSPRRQQDKPLNTNRRDGSPKKNLQAGNKVLDNSRPGSRQTNNNRASKDSPKASTASTTADGSPPTMSLISKAATVMTNGDSLQNGGMNGHTSSEALPQRPARNREGKAMVNGGGPMNGMVNGVIDGEE